MIQKYAFFRLLFFQIILLKIVSTDIYSVSLFNSNTSSNINLIFTTVQVESSHIIAIIQPNSTNASNALSFFLPTDTYRNATMPIWPNNGGNYSVKIRTAPFNSYLPNKTSFLLFSNNLIQLTSNMTTKVQTIYTAQGNGTVKIQQLCFGNSINQIYILQSEPNCILATACYTLTSLINNRTLYKLKIPIVYLLNPSRIMKYYKNRIFIYFNEKIIGYSISSNYTFTQIVNISLIFNITTKMDMKIYNNILYFSTSQGLYIYNLTSRAQSTIFLNPDIQCFTLLYPYVILKTGTYIYQYDIQINRFIATYYLTNFNQSDIYSCDIINNNRFVIYKDKSPGRYKFQILEIDGKATCNCGFNCSTCANYTSVNNTLCIKNLSNYITNNNQSQIMNSNNSTLNNLTNCTNTSNLANSTNLTTNNTDLINSTNLMNLVIKNNSTNIINFTNLTNITNFYNSNNTQNSDNATNPNNITIFEEYNLNPNSLYYFMGIKNQTLNIISKNLGTVLIFTSLRIAPKFLFAFLLFLDDLWLYKFHRKHNPQYPNIAQSFMQKIDLVKDIQNSISIMPSSNFIVFDDSMLINKNSQLIRYSLFSSNDPNSLFFLYSIQDLYSNCIPFNILLFVGLKVIHLVLFSLRKKLHIINQFYKCFSNQTRWWNLVVAIIEANMIVLIYSSSLQLLNNSFIDSLNKLNNICAIVISFLCIIYAITFYPLLFQFDKKNAASALLIRCKYSHNSFWYESVLIISRSMLKTFVHGYFITNYEVQITLLFILDIPYLIVIMKMRKYFKNVFIFATMALYFLGFTIFNLFFVLQIVKENALPIDRQLFGLIISCVLGLLSVLLALILLSTAIYELINDIKQFIESLKEKNKIKPKLKKTIQQFHMNDYLNNLPKKSKKLTNNTNINLNSNKNVGINCNKTNNQFFKKSRVLLAINNNFEEFDIPSVFSYLNSSKKIQGIKKTKQNLKSSKYILQIKTQKNF